MQRYPLARADEIDAALRRLAPKPGETILDVPSGAGYLSGDLPAGLTLHQIDPSPGFSALNPRVRSAPLHRLPLPDASVDGVISLAGLHHLDSLSPLLHELRRVLKPTGRVVLADVAAGSPEDAFLDGFVHAHNPQGHRGRYLDPSLEPQLRAAGLPPATVEDVRYAWHYPSQAALVDGVREMFGLDATDAQMLQGLRQHGAHPTPTGWALPWGLRFAVARPSTR